MSENEESTPAKIAPGEWQSVLEELLRGVVHASNNRFTTLLSLAQLAELDGGTADDAAVMRQELSRLHEVISTIGALVGPVTQPEALDLHAMLASALALNASHSRARGAPCEVRRSGGEAIVRVPRAALLRYLLLSIHSARQANPDAPDSAPVITLQTSESHVRLTTPSAVAPGADALALTAACGGVLHADGAAWTLELPSLIALRARERAQARQTPVAGA
jgi:hypothetical protein